MQRVHLANLSLGLILVGGSVVAYPHVPPEIPGHFNAAGQATYWTEATFWRWMLAPLVGAGLCAMLYALLYWSPKDSRWWNIPYKEDILALPGPLRDGVLEEVDRLMLVLVAAMLLIFNVIQWGKFHAVTSGDDGLPLLVVLFLGAMFLFLMFYPIAWLVRFGRVVEEVKARHEEESDAGSVG